MAHLSALSVEFALAEFEYNLKTMTKALFSLSNYAHMCELWAVGGEQGEVNDVT